MKKIDYDKFANTVLYLLDRCTPTRPGLIALMKLVWYVDYWHYRRFLRPVTDGQYVALRMGPALDDYEELFERMCGEGIVKKTQVEVFGKPNKKTEYLPLKKPNVELFTATEQRVLRVVVEQLGQLSGEDLVKRTHNEGPWPLVWDENEPGTKQIPQSLWRWSDNLPDEEDLKVAQEYVKRPEVQAALKKIRHAAKQHTAAV